jgi:hypothetical protein
MLSPAAPSTVIGVVAPVAATAPAKVTLPGNTLVPVDASSNTTEAGEAEEATVKLTAVEDVPSAPHDTVVESFVDE